MIEISPFSGPTLLLWPYISDFLPYQRAEPDSRYVRAVIHRIIQEFAQLVTQSESHMATTVHLPLIVVH